MLMAARLAL
ncbi:hypothetical protein MHYP_G00193780 [Metynnis hypsauchen]